MNPVLAVAAVGLEALWLLYAPDSRAPAAPAVGPEVRAVPGGPARAGARRRACRLLSPADQGARAGARSNGRGTIRQPGCDQPVADERAAEGRTRQDRPARRGVPRHGRQLHPLRAVPRLGRRRRPGARADPVRGQRQDGSAWTTRPSRCRVRTWRSSSKRLDKMQEIKRYLTVARGQLDLIDNSFQLIADQIVTMQSPQQLSGQLDELLSGVESIRAERRRHRSPARIHGHREPRYDRTARASRLGRGPATSLPAR